MGSRHSKGRKRLGARGRLRIPYGVSAGAGPAECASRGCQEQHVRFESRRPEHGGSAPSPAISSRARPAPGVRPAVHPKYRFLDPSAGPTTLVDLLRQRAECQAGRPRLYVSGRRRIRGSPSDLWRARPAGPGHRGLARVAGPEGSAGPAPLPARTGFHRGVLRLSVCRSGRGAGVPAADEPRAVPHPGDRRRCRRDGGADNRCGPGAGQAADRPDVGSESDFAGSPPTGPPTGPTRGTSGSGSGRRSPATRWPSFNTPRARRGRPKG